jgi:YesN/AraC family two-component response regulator
MKVLKEEKSFKRLILLLEILNELAQSDEFEYLSTDDYHSAYNQKEFERIQMLYNYIHENFQGKINIDQAAQLVSLTKSAFCKFIKRKTKKTFSQIVNEVRLGKATNLLRETELPITQICYEVGYNDLSYFFRQFQKTMGTSPKQFRTSFN